MAKSYTFVDAELLTAALINAHLTPDVPAAGDAISVAWVDATSWVAAGYSSTDLKVCRVGDVIYWRGTVVPTTNWGAANADNIVIAASGVPSAYRAVGAHHVWVAASVGSVATTVFRTIFNTNGAMNARPSTATVTTGMYVNTSYRKLA